MNKVTEILAELIRDCPCCSCCSGDDGYIERVAACFRLVEEDLWPDIDTGLGQHRNLGPRLRSLLNNIKKDRLDEARKKTP